jgi:outer membrane protein TolC
MIQFNINKKLSALLAVALGFVSLGNAQQALTLAAAKEFAVKNAFQVKTTNLDAQSAKLQTDQLLAIGLPQINGSIQYQNFIDRPTSILPGDFFGMPGQNVAVQFGVPQTLTAGINASQLLFDGSWLVGLQASRAYAALQNKNIIKSEIDVKRATEEAYHLAVISQESIALLSASRDLLATTLEQTKALKNEGFVETQDVEQLSLSLNELDARIRVAQTQALVAKTLLKFTIGMNVDEEITLLDNSTTILESFNTQLVQTAFNADNLIDNQIIKEGLALQKLSVKNQQAGLLPNLAGFYSLQRQAQRQEFNFFDGDESWYPTQLWGLSMNIPIVSGGNKMKGIQKAEVEVKRMEETLAFSTNAAKLEYQVGMAEYMNATQNVDLAMQSYNLASSILQKTQIKFDQGTSSSFELSRQTSQLLQAQVSLIQARLSLMNAQTRLSKSLNAL